MKNDNFRSKIIYCNQLSVKQLNNINNWIFDNIDIQEATIRDYKVRVRQFLKFIQFRGLTANSFLEYKQQLRKEPTYTISTKNKYLIAAKIYLKELYKQGYLTIDITINVKGFIQNKRHKRKGVSDGDIIKLSKYCRRLKKTPENLRKRALIALFLFQGLRQVEVIRLDVTDINLKDRILFIHGKGKDDKEPIPLHPKTVEVLKEYICRFKIKDGAVFRSISNNCKNHRLTTKSIREIIKTIFKEAGINNSVHGFRHYYVTKLLKTYKGNLIKVSEYTRHKSLEMLQVYNDDILKKEDLPKYYKAFKGISF